MRAAIFSLNLVLSVTRYHDQLSSCTISEKTNDSILRKVSDGRTEGQTGRQTNNQTDRRGIRHRWDETHFKGSPKTRLNIQDRYYFKTSREL